MKRIPDVLDCWFESGSMPYAQLHYPFENKEKFEKNFPAEFIAEGVDQTRAWFYYLHVLATALKDKPAFKNVVVNGIVLAEDGKKMSKHLKNYTDPLEMMEKYGADPMRYYLATSPVVEAEDLWFSEKAVEEILKKVILILLNVLSFYKLYVSAPKISLEMHLGNVLDVWIISRLETLKEEVTMQYEQYNLAKANRPIAEFIEDLSTWYVRRSRERFKNGDEEAMHTLGYVLLELAKVMAPVMPFVSDYIYKEIGGEKVSIHLEDWPTVNKNLINPEVLEKMKQTRKAVEIGLALRSEHQIKIRQPLKLIQFSDEEMFNNLYEDVVKEELNVKEIALGEKDWLDTEITPELEEEGILRELTRSVNQLRKERGLKIDEKNVILEYETSEADLKALIGKSATVLKKNCLLKEIVMVQGLPEAKTMEINGKEIKFNLKY